MKEIYIKVPKFSLIACKVGRIFLSLVKILVICMVAHYNFSTKASYIERESTSMKIAGLVLLLFFFIELIQVLLNEAEHEGSKVSLTNLAFFIGARLIITACIVLLFMLLSKNFIKIQGDTIEVTKTNPPKQITQVEYVNEYVEAESDKPLYPINFEQNGTVILSCSNADEAFVKEFIANNGDLIDTRTIMLNNGNLGLMTENENVSEIKFYDTQTSMSTLLEMQDVNGCILYVGSPNLVGYEGTKTVHDAQLILVTPVKVTAEEKALLNESFKSVKIIGMETLK